MGWGTHHGNQTRGSPASTKIVTDPKRNAPEEFHLVKKWRLCLCEPLRQSQRTPLAAFFNIHMVVGAVQLMSDKH